MIEDDAGSDSATVGESIEKWEAVFSHPDFKLKDQLMISLDDRALLNLAVSFKCPKYRNLTKAVINTYDESIKKSMDNFPRIQPPTMQPFTYEIERMLIATSTGVLFGLHQGINIHRRLREYHNLSRTMCVDGIPIKTATFPDRKPCQTNILFLPQYQHDSTQLRMTRYIGHFGFYEYFLEKNTGTIRKIHKRFSNIDATQVFSPFHEPPDYVKFYLHNREIMTPLEIFKKSIRIAKAKKIQILKFKKEEGLKYTAIIDEVPCLGDPWFLDNSDSDAGGD